MSELMLMIALMNTSGTKREMPPPEPKRIVQEVQTERPALTDAERQELRQAAERMARESNGEMVRAEGSNLYVPSRQVKAAIIKAE